MVATELIWAGAKAPAKESEGSLRGRSAFLVGTVARDATLGFGLRKPGRVAERITENRGSNRGSREWVELSGCNGTGAVRTLLGRRFELRIVAYYQLAALIHAHHAVVFAIASAARRQPSLRILSHSQHGEQERQAEHSEHQDGDEATQ